MKARKPNETDGQYIKRLEDANHGLKQQNDQLSKWACNISEAVTHLSTEGSVVFQAMAEKAGVRGHPSITAVVELFDSIAHPQLRGEKAFPKVVWPQDWDFDKEGEWSGDADMALNSPVDEAIQLLEALKFETKDKFHEPICKAQEGLHMVLIKGVDGHKAKAGFKPKEFGIPQKRYDEMTLEELKELVSVMSWAALDLAQDMNFSNEMLRRDLRASAYRRVCGDLYALSQMDCNPPPGKFNVKVFGDEAPF